ncbi:MAG: retron system putative HNH endonuclease [Leucothrix sp.]
MRYIKQRFLSKCLNRRRHNPPETTVAAKKAWRRTNKKDIRKACYKQQLGICAYTELSLDNTELGYHLEHIAPRSNYPERTFVPHNIILSIMDDVYSGTLPHSETFGGHHKSEDYADDWFISPFDRNCASYFDYKITGLVAASTTLGTDEQLKADRTIAILNLNADYLVACRNTSLQTLTEQIERMSVSLLGEDKRLNALAQLAEVTLLPFDKKLPEFYSAKKQLFERLGVNFPVPL